MTRTSVVNLRKSFYDVYVGRYDPTLGDGYFGNPFPISKTRDRKASIAAFRTWFLERVETDAAYRQRVLALRGLRLGCFCVPRDCHAHVMVAWIEAQEATHE